MEEIEADKLSKEDIDVRLKWLGLFHRRKHQYGRFMMRLKLPNGVTTSEQTRYLASVIEAYGEEGCADVTTRQNWQIRGVTLPDVPGARRQDTGEGHGGLRRRRRKMRLAREEEVAAVAVEVESAAPYEDFRESMVAMVVEKEMYAWEDLNALLHQFLSLNSPRHHALILHAFADLWAPRAGPFCPPSPCLSL
ncbi:hypothetical protein GUJ93_ZPchr0005g14849 [Zizania palustris]|uniref:OVATE domain-containing protein n=1 Tax=Zizania palustris TaxID=103762 RepID=A0A8J5S430_ZIZPA|nr:hypothetical protein GUJ93_ZPchr0005g14849 [Zizania palustris]